MLIPMVAVQTTFRRLPDSTLIRFRSRNLSTFVPSESALQPVARRRGSSALLGVKARAAFEDNAFILFTREARINFCEVSVVSAQDDKTRYLQGLKLVERYGTMIVVSRFVGKVESVELAFALHPLAVQGCGKILEHA